MKNFLRWMCTISKFRCYVFQTIPIIIISTLAILGVYNALIFPTLLTLYIILLVIFDICKSQITNKKYGKYTHAIDIASYNVGVRNSIKDGSWSKHTRENMSPSFIRRMMIEFFYYNRLYPRHILKDVDIILTDNMIIFTKGEVGDVSHHIKYFDFDSFEFRYAIVLDIKKISFESGGSSQIMNDTIVRLIIHEYMHIYLKTGTTGDWDNAHRNLTWKRTNRFDFDN